MLSLSMYFESSFSNVILHVMLRRSVSIEFVIYYYAQKFLLLHITN